MFRPDNDGAWALPRPSNPFPNDPPPRTQFHVMQGPPKPSGTVTAPVVANPYDLLGIPRTTTSDEVVEAAFRKWAIQLHPDRGGDPKRFQIVADAYRRIKEELEHARTESCELLKMRAERELGDHNVPGGGEVRQELAPLGSGTAFDKATFNQVFFEHRIWDPNDDGYGAEMAPSASHATVYDKLKDIPQDVTKEREMDLQPQMVPHFTPSAQFNSGKLVNFNDTFRSQAAQQQTKRQFNNSQKQSLVRRVEPDSLEMFKGAGSSLSVEKVEDFSSPFNTGGGSSGNFCDYMKAFSEDALITQHTGFDSGYGRAGNVSEAEFARYVNKTQQLSFLPDPELVNARAMQDAYEREQDELRFRNFLKRAEEIDEQHRSLRNVLPERSRTTGK